jgi:hypothetical protein
MSALREAEAKVAAEIRGGRWGSDQPPDGPDEDRHPVFDDTDIAAGREFVVDHGPVARFVSDWRRWYVYDGRRWQEDAANTAVEALGKQTAARLAESAVLEVADAARAVVDAGDEDDEAETAAKRKMAAAKRRLAFAKRLQDIRALRRMLDAARSDPA